MATIADEAVAAARDVFALVNADRQRVLAASGASVIAVRLLEHARSGVPVWCIFDNTAHDHATVNALGLLERLSAGRKTESAD